MDMNMKTVILDKVGKALASVDCRPVHSWVESNIFYFSLFI